MTGILTKQNAIDKALVGGGGGGTGDTNGLLNTLHVYHDATFDGPTRFENFDGASVTFKSTPVFENDLNAVVDGEIVSIKILQENDVKNEYAVECVADALGSLDDRYEDMFRTVNDNITKLSNTIDEHLTENPDIINNNNNNNNNNDTSTQVVNALNTLSTIALTDTEVLLDEGEVTEEPQPDEELPELTPEDVDAVFDTLISHVNESLNHFETNDETLHLITLDHDRKIKVLDDGMALATEMITNINACIDDELEPAINKNTTDITQLKTDVDELTNDVSSISNTMACKVDLDDVNEKLTNEINSLNTAVDNRYTKSEVDDKLKPINDKLIGDVGSIERS